MSVDMNKALQQYFISKLIDDIRSGQPLHDDLISALQTYPLIDQLRNAVTESDLVYLAINSITCELSRILRTFHARCGRNCFI